LRKYVAKSAGSFVVGIVGTKARNYAKDEIKFNLKKDVDK
jgi:hypothetical protein